MKKIKSLLSILLAVIMLFVCLPTASAASASISARSSKTSVSYDDTVTVTISLDSNSGMAGINFTLTYNSSQLKYVSSANGSAGSAFSMKSVNQNGSAIKGAFLNADGTLSKATGTLATVTFKVISTGNVSAPLSLSGTGTDTDGSVISVSASGTTLKIGTPPTSSTTKPTTKPTTTKPTTTKPTTTKPTTTAPTTTEPEESTTKVIATETIAVQKGNVYQLAKPSSMSGKITYTSSNSSVASVSDTGVITTNAKGMTTIKAASENGVTKTWLLIVGDGSMVESESETTTEEETTTEIAVIGDVTEESTTEEETTAETDSNNKKNDGDETFRLIFGTGAAVAVLIVIIVIASMIRKKRSFVG